MRTLRTVRKANIISSGIHGFTLVELLLYISVSSILLLATSLFLSVLLESRIKNQAISEVEQQGIQVMQLITQTVRNSDAINSPLQGQSSPSLSLGTSGGGNPTIFSLASNVIQIVEGAGVPIPLTNSRITASTLLFSNFSRASTPDIVKIQFTLTSVNTSGKNEYSYSKNFVDSAALRQP